MPSKTRFIELKEIFEILHGPRGCLWDRQQTHQSLVPHLKEEVGEFVAAVREGDNRKMCEELGDLLLLVMFNAQIARRRKGFDIEDVISGLISKLKRRHPHVFGDIKVKSARQIIRNWNKIKSTEKK
ncbi:MAG: MazG nucleotide pyrophosphohydrolase domain-containing protein [Candidatus Omnitrophota bacterium]